MATAQDKPGVRGRFITLEGIDGCGKSTQAHLLGERLQAAGLPVRKTREPGGTPIGAQLRAVLLDARNAALAPHAELLLYLADRVQHLQEVIRPALAAGEVVLCDRYHDATVAYQGHGRGLDFAPLADFIAAEILRTPPHLTLWLDVPVAVGQARIAARNNAHPTPAPVEAESRLDSEHAAFHARVREGYAAIHAAEPERVVRIDAAAAVEAIHEQIWAVLTERYDVV